MTTTMECRRHGFPYGAEAAKPGGFYVSRCAHVDNRFVVEIKPEDGHPFITVDYVEDDDNGYPHLIQPHSAETQDEADELWEALTADLREGAPVIDVSVMSADRS